MATLRWAFPLLLLVVAPVWAQDVVSGPDKGGKVPALKVFDVTGPNQGKAVDYKTERKDRPTIYVFVQADKWDRPMARFLKELDKIVQKEGENISVVAVWLTEDVRKTKQYLPLAQQSLQFQQTALTCFEGEKTGPKDWNINTDAHATAVVANKGKVAAVFGYASLNETDAAAVQKALKKAREEK
ncbi:MAG TPA: hypothetical protein VEL76_05300 [Gemmataceae bacterium]|nr:hypothetical protein [Gemmataceae bacterium]